VLVHANAKAPPGTSHLWRTQHRPITYSSSSQGPLNLVRGFQAAGYPLGEVHRKASLAAAVTSHSNGLLGDCAPMDGVRRAELAWFVAEQMGTAPGMDHDGLVGAAQRLSKSLTPGDLDHTLSRITAAAVEVLPEAEYSSITVMHADGRLETVAPTDDLLWDLDMAQHKLHEGPCYEAVVDTAHVTAPNLASDQRFPRYAAVAVAAGIRAQAAIRLFDAPKSQGALNLYSRNVGAFEDFGSLARLFAHQSAMAIEYAQEIHNLQEAMRTRRTIGQAVGIVMERYKLTDERAFAFLTRLSQHRNIRLRLVAQEIVTDLQQQGDEASGPG